MTGDTELNPYAAPAPAADLGGFAPREPAQMEMASRGARLGGLLIDSLLLLASMVPVVVAGGLLGLFDQPSSPNSTSLAPALLVAMILPMLLFQGYQWYLIATTGQSLAKRWVRTRIVRASGEPPGFVHGVLLRAGVISVLGAIPFVGSFIGIANACFIFRRDVRCLHDHIAGTFVVRV